MIARFLYQNPRILVLVVGLISVAGTSAYLVMPRMEDPILTRRIGVVKTVFPGASADRVDSLITRPIEESIQEVDGIEEIRSMSSGAVSSIQIELEDHVTDVENTWSLVRDRLDDVTPSLPEEALTPEFLRPRLKASAIIAALKWRGQTETNFVLLRRLSEELKDTIRSVPGTESAVLFGDPEEQITVEVEPQVLASLGITVPDLAGQIEASEANLSGGVFRAGEKELLIDIAGESSLDRLGSVPIAVGERRDQLLNLADIASLSRGLSDSSSGRALIDGVPAVVISAWVRNEQRIDLWTEKLKPVLDEFETSLPPEVECTTIFAQNDYVSKRLALLQQNLLMAMGAVVVIVFLMMGWRSMIVVTIVLPLSALIVLSGMRWMEIPIHQMSVTGLIIALGLLIDNAIIIVDDVRSRLWDGATKGDAISGGIRHLALPLFGSTLTTALAFAPIALLPGSVGEFVGSVAVSVILAISGSFLLAMTVIPALTVFSHATTIDKHSLWNTGLGSEFFTRMYRWSLVKLFEAPFAGLFLGLCLPVFGFLQLRNLPEQFFPPVKRNQIAVDLELAASSSIDETLRVAKAARESARAHEGVANVHWFIGGVPPTFYYNLMPARRNSSHYAQGMVDLNAGADSKAVIRELQDELDEAFPQARIVVRQLEQGPPIDAPVEIRLFGPDPAELERIGNDFRGMLSSIPHVVHTVADLGDSVPSLAVRLHEGETKIAGLSHDETAKQLYTSLEGIEAGTLMDGTEELPVRVRLSDSARSNLAQITSLQIRALTARGRSPEGPPLDAIGTLELDSQVSSVSRLNGRKMNSVKAYLTAGILPAEVAGEMKKRIEQSEFSVESGYRYEFAGEGAERNEAVNNLVADITLIVSLMIASLVCTFRSFRVSAIIASVGGLSIGLGFASLWIFGYPFGFMAILGIMGLVGIAINDAIVVMAGIREDPGACRGGIEAMADIVIERTRHVLTTSFTTMAGFTPLVLGGGEFWPPVAIAIAGGVAGATILALYFVPSLYLLIVGRRVL